MEAHDDAILLYGGGTLGVININNIKSAIARPYVGYYPKIWEKAAALFESVCRNHGFADGNKRTAVLLLDVLLENSGYKLNSLSEEDTNDTLEELAVNVASGQLEKSQIEQWFYARVIKIESDACDSD